MPNFDIVLLTEARYVRPKNPDWYAHQIFEDDALLTAELEKLGLAVPRKDWADQNSLAKEFTMKRVLKCEHE